MKRREFMTLICGAAAAWPLVAHAQQRAMPVIGVLGSGSPAPLFTDALAEGLKETGYVEGRNVRIEYRWANGAYDRLPALAAELVDLRVSVLATFGTAAARVAKATSVKVAPRRIGRFFIRKRPGSGGARCELQSAGRQHDRLNQHRRIAGAEGWNCCGRFFAVTTSWRS